VDWESMLTEPLDVVRSRLHLMPAVLYPIAATA
jgi:hypothetical protein